MITLCFLSVLYPHPNDKVMHFKPEFIAWCEEWGEDYQISVVALDRGHPTYDTNYDFEIGGLTGDDEVLWVLRWGKSARIHPRKLPPSIGRYSIAPPYENWTFTTEVER